MADHIKEYDPNIHWARHSFALIFMQWDYSLTIEVDVLGNCKGASLFGDAISAVFDELWDDDEQNAKIILKRPTKDADETGFDTLECDIEDEDELEKMCVSIQIVGHVKEDK